MVSCEFNESKTETQNLNSMLNILTIDVEDYFQVHAFSNIIKYENWGNYGCRVEHNTDRLLEILGHSIRDSQSGIRNQTKATFFVLGWMAERYPDLVRRIQKEGHEVACHGYAHKLVYTQTKEEFREDTRKTKIILENITGSEVIGYRAPSFSITHKSQWAFEVLIEEGFKYDSSIFPIRHDFYGFPTAPRFPFLVSSRFSSHVEFSPHLTSNAPKTLIEFPISTVRLFGQNLPISGGGYFRLFPYPLIRKGLRSVNEKEGKPFIFYLHPWEIDPDQPRVNNIPLRSKFRHYVKLDKTESKLKKLLEDFQFSSIRDVMERNFSTAP